MRLILEVLRYHGYLPVCNCTYSHIAWNMHMALLCFDVFGHAVSSCGSMWYINTLRPRQNRRHFADDIFKSIFLNENTRISLKISLKFVPKVRINNIPPLVQIMAWRLPGDKPLSEPMMVRLLTHICVTRPQWVNHYSPRLLHGHCGNHTV